MLTKIIAGTRDRKSRLHDELGHRVSISRLLRNGTRAAATGIRYKLTGQFAQLPWISYDGQTLLAVHLKPSSTVLEFGSGSSTAWYAARSSFVLSIEHDSDWFGMVGGWLGNLANVERVLKPDFSDYAAAGIASDRKEFDLIMIDGMVRDQCLERSLPLLAPGGMVYLDNSDKANASRTGDIPRARRMLFDYAQANDKHILTITDFAPSQFAPNEATILFN